jgi:hypothetical protein
MNKKTMKNGLLFLSASALLGLINLYALDTPKTSPSVVFSPLEGKSWAEESIQTHPEILWLADSHVRKTEEGQAISQGSYSEQIFGQKFVEFDRTLMTLHCLRLILDGSDSAYQEFTAAQPKELKLTKKSFEELHQEGQHLLKSGWAGMSEEEIAEAMETALVLGDIGKSEKARAQFKPYGIGAPDHDDFHEEAMGVLLKHPELCPSFLNLPEKAKKGLTQVANLAHYGHITHLEGDISMFDKLISSSIPTTDPIGLKFDLFVHTCDVAGALGHVNNKSSLMYTEPVHKAIQATGDAVCVLSGPNKTAFDAYEAYLAVRASWLGLDSKNAVDRVLARIGAMLRLCTLEDGVILRQAISSLGPVERDGIIAELDIQKTSGLRRTPTYMPAVLINLLNNPHLGATKEERLSQAIALGLPCICRVLKEHKQQLSNDVADPNIPLNFNPVAGIAKAAPELLSNGFTIDAEGNVSLVDQ